MARQKLTQLKETITRLLAGDSDIAFAYIFGSQTKGTAGTQSDVDVAIYLNGIDAGPAGDQAAVEKQISLNLRLEQTLKRPADVVILNRASVDMRQNALVRGILLFCTNDRLHQQFKRDQLRLYQDFVMMEPIFRYYRRKRIKEGTFGGRTDNRPQTAGHH